MPHVILDINVTENIFVGMFEARLCSVDHLKECKLANSLVEN